MVCRDGAMTTTLLLVELPDTVDDGQSLILDLDIVSFCFAESSKRKLSVLHCHQAVYVR